MAKHIRLIYQNTGETTQFGDLQKANIVRNGERGIDVASFEVSNRNEVKQNANIKFLSDVADVTFLTAIYNFQGSFRDESGINSLDGSGSAGFETPNTGNNTYKFSPNYAVEFDSAGEEVTVAHNSVLDFTKQFDISIAFTMNSSNPNNHFNGNSNNTQILFSKHDGTNGVEIGIKYVSYNWRVYAKLNSTTFTGNGTVAESTINQTAPRYIRFYRDNKDVVRLQLDGVTEGTNCKQTVATTTTVTSSPLYFGTSYLNVNGTTTNNYDYHGLIHQIRVYCGGYLSEKEYEQIIYTEPQCLTMKFSGIVRKVKAKLDKHILEAHSISKAILTSNLSSSILSGNVSSATTNEPATRELNIFNRTQAPKNILQSIIYKADSSFIWFNGIGSGSSGNLAGEYVATGSVSKNMQTLALFDTKTFIILPTKTFIYERDGDMGQSNGVDTGYVFDHDRYRIYNRGTNDVKVLNDVEVLGKITTAHKSISGVNASGTLDNSNNLQTPIDVSLSGFPIDVKITDNIGVFVDIANYNIKIYQQKIQFVKNDPPSGVNWSNLTIEYTYEHTGSGSILYHRDEDSSSINSFGRNSRRFITPQLTENADIRSLATQLKNRFKQIDTRYTVDVPYLHSGIRENHNITLNNSNMKFTGTGGTLSNSNATVKVNVKTIEWQFPENKTIITCGEFDYDMYDLEQAQSQSVSGLSDNTLTTQNL